MRLLSLQIRGVRGIRELDLDFSSASAVFLGGNGSGKSAIVDSIDFLLSGGISRLEGAGTGAASLTRHGAHVVCDRNDSSVEAEFDVEAAREPLRLRRTFRTPSVLQRLSGDWDPVTGLLDVCTRRAYILTRRDLLRFITARPQDRAEQVHALLDLSDIEGLRTASVTAATRALTGHSAAAEQVTQAERRIAQTLSLTTFSQDAALAKVNELRDSLGGLALDALSSGHVKRGLQAPAAAATDPELDELTSALIAVRQHLSAESLTEAESAVQDLRLAVAALLAEDRARTLARQQRLVLEGIAILGEGSDCPLCDTRWPEGELLSHLESKRDRAERATPLLEDVAAAAGRIQGWIEGPRERLERIASASEEQVPIESKAVVSAFTSALSGIAEQLADPETADLFQEDAAATIATTVASAQVEGLVTTLLEALIPDDDGHQDAWDCLTRVEENLVERENAQDLTASSAVVATRAAAFRAAVSEAREAVLSGLYESAQNRFADLYRIVHEPDEQEFRASLSVDEAGLGLKVPFHDQGDHAPFALHSEGHQDSMGLCLFLALFEALDEAPGFVVLDDVLMSIDRGHRRGVCRMLRSEFADRQLIVTTHDRVWADRLRQEGIVPNAALHRLKNWSLQSGPVVEQEPGLWERIAAALADEDVPAASHRLRRGLEQFWQEVCQALDAKVPLRMSAEWELGQTYEAGMKRLRTLIKKARNVAERQGQPETAEACAGLLDEMRDIRAAVEADRWMINMTTHYNPWAELEPDEFAPIAEAFKRACALFECPECGGRICLLRTGDRQERQVACPRGCRSWSLTGPWSGGARR